MSNSDVFPRYNVTIAAETDSLPPLVAYTQITISVLDENDNTPEFDADVYRGTVREGLPAGTRVVQGEYRATHWGRGLSVPA